MAEKLCELKKKGGSSGGATPTLYNHATSTGRLNTSISSPCINGNYYYLHFYMTGHSGGLATGNSSYTVVGADIIYNANAYALKNYGRNAEFNALVKATSSTITVTQTNIGGSTATDWVSNLVLYDI